MASSKASPAHGVASIAIKKNGHMLATMSKLKNLFNLYKAIGHRLLSRTMTYPIETQHMLLCEAKRRALVMPDDVVSILDSALVANAIIKDAKAERRLRALAIARRLHYCLSA
jgi:hypothetical protein